MREPEAERGTLGADDLLNEAVDRFLTPRPTPVMPRDEDLLRQGTTRALNCGPVVTVWGDGSTVLLAHGWESRRTHWGAFIPALNEAGFRAVAVDAPAHGDSPEVRTNVLEYGRMLLGVGQEFGTLAGIIGHSFGAGATAVALHRGLKADRAVLLSGPSSLVAVVERWARGYGLPEHDIPEFVRRVGREVGAPLTGLDVARFAAELTTPALIVHDRGDKEIPVEDGLAVAANWPGARSLITDRYGHRRVLIAGEVVNAVVAFLSGRGG